MIILNDINLTLGKGTTLEKKIFSNLKLEIKAGEFIVIIGGNGVGKSTLLNLIAGLISPNTGDVIIDGQPINRLSPPARAQLAALVLQDPKAGTMEQMTIEENLSFALSRGKSRHLFPYKNSHRANFFKDKLALLDMNLENRMVELVANLSGGQRQALSLMMAKISTSKILLLDEITAALDPKMAQVIMQLTAKLVREENRTTIMITHNMQHALAFGDRTMVLADGKVQRIYTAAEKQKMSAAELAASFEHGCW